jgi:hypothetical protein
MLMLTLYSGWGRPRLAPLTTWGESMPETPHGRKEDSGDLAQRRVRYLHSSTFSNLGRRQLTGISSAIVPNAGYRGSGTAGIGG